MPASIARFFFKNGKFPSAFKYCRTGKGKFVAIRHTSRKTIEPWLIEVPARELEKTTDHLMPWSFWGHQDDLEEEIEAEQEDRKRKWGGDLCASIEEVWEIRTREQARKVKRARRAEQPAKRIAPFLSESTFMGNHQRFSPEERKTKVAAWRQEKCGKTQPWVRAKQAKLSERRLRKDLVLRWGCVAPPLKAAFVGKLRGGAWRVLMWTLRKAAVVSKGLVRLLAKAFHAGVVSPIASRFRARVSEPIRRCIDDFKVGWSQWADARRTVREEFEVRRDSAKRAETVRDRTKARQRATLSAKREKARRHKRNERHRMPRGWAKTAAFAAHGAGACAEALLRDDLPSIAIDAAIMTVDVVENLAKTLAPAAIGAAQVIGAAAASICTSASIIAKGIRWGWQGVRSFPAAIREDVAAYYAMDEKLAASRYARQQAHGAFDPSRGQAYGQGYGYPGAQAFTPDWHPRMFGETPGMSAPSPTYVFR